MDHNQRLALAIEIAQRLLAAHGEQVIAVAAWGSLAQWADTAYSDLDLWAVTTGGLPRREVCRVYRGIAVQVGVSPATALLAEASRVGPYWPIDAAKWHEYLGLFERADFFARLRHATSSVRDGAFVPAIRDRMVRLHEVGGKLHSSRVRGDRYGLLKAGRDLTHNTAIIIGLANRRYYPNTRELYPLSLQMPLQPEAYPQLLDPAGGFTTVDPSEVYAAAARLWDNLQQFVRRLGVEWEDDAFAL
jgi:kanamycin nucleotidyltransferase